MEKAKEVAHKVAGTAGEEQHEQQQGKSGLERNLEPKPTKVHLPIPGTEEKSLYVPSGKLRGKRALVTGGSVSTTTTEHSQASC
jgi:hypothetical protein